MGEGGDKIKEKRNSGGAARKTCNKIIIKEIDFAVISSRAAGWAGMKFIKGTIHL